MSTEKLTLEALLVRWEKTPHVLIPCAGTLTTEKIAALIREAVRDLAQKSEPRIAPTSSAAAGCNHDGVNSERLPDCASLLATQSVEDPSRHSDSATTDGGRNV